MQIPFNGSNFINALCIFCLTRGPMCSWRNGNAVLPTWEQCRHLWGLFSLQKSNQTLFTLRIAGTAARGLAFPACTHARTRAHTHTHISLRLSAQFLFSARTSLSLSLSLHLLSFCSARGREKRSLIQLNTDIMLLASLILHASIAKITEQLLSLSYGYFI